ncbi:ATP-binding response regulator [Rhodocyclus tenuis]|uniref:Anti-sigma regulatory factor (Ser/Thr protein kinase) n=1 Tax=Rhodocyclus tenuis TaxID=1066 RepID=A0A840FVV8_RHOTE|nr:ATP-binding protein [Rhodocyclus tenuis]MBB4245874.1 anti-sigma regulatory factor (Ser/Thr protein kinase) [Rhodocyclus tenuis]
MHLILVDSSPAQRAFIASALADRAARLSTLGCADAAAGLVTTSAGNNGQGSADGITVLLVNCAQEEASGLALLRRIRANAQFATMPAILLTPAVSDGALEYLIPAALELGARYALPDDGDAEALRFVIDALRDDAARNATRADETAGGRRQLRAASFAVRSLDDAKCLAPVLAAATSRHSAAVLGISELLINSIEHGNLGISYARKKELMLQGRWREEIERRSALPENGHKRVRIRLRRTADGAYIQISDEGPGFDWRQYLEFDTRRANDPNGRGIAVARMTSFDSLDYLGGGNVVVARIKAPICSKDTKS